MPEPEGGSMSSCSPLYTGPSTSTNELLIILGHGNGVYLLYTRHITFPWHQQWSLIYRSKIFRRWYHQFPVWVALITWLKFSFWRICWLIVDHYWSGSRDSKWSKVHTSTNWSIHTMEPRWQWRWLLVKNHWYWKWCTGGRLDTKQQYCKFLKDTRGHDIWSNMSEWTWEHDWTSGGSKGGGSIIDRVANSH